MGLRSFLLVVAAVPVATSASAAGSACGEAADLREHILNLQPAFEAIKRAATPICRVKDRPRCKRLIAELEHLHQLMQEANAERKSAEAACEKEKGKQPAPRPPE